jgi:hypothetical protein
MTRELQNALAAVETISPAELPDLITALAKAQALALQRLASPVAQPPSVPEQAETLDVEQAAAYIKMSSKWLYRNVDIVPHLRIGNGHKPRIRFRRRDLDVWLQQHRTKR